MRLVFDIETNGLDYRAEGFKIHCVCIICAETRDEWSYVDNIDKAVDLLNTADEIIGHNIQAFDIPVLQHYTKKTITSKPFDTAVLSRLMFPLEQGHSLKEWGQRLGVLKGDFVETTDWQTFTPEMLEYCMQDCRVTLALYKRLKAQNWSQESTDLETKVASIMHEQTERGVCFDINKATELYAQLAATRSAVQLKLNDLFPPFISPSDKRKTPKLIEFNPASKDHIAFCLKQKYNWEPTKVTPTGKACVDDEVLSQLEYSEAKLLSEFTQLNKIIGMLAEGDQAWLKLVKNERIHGQVFTTGTITGRMSHGKPNLAQVPRVTSYMGKECRSLFIASLGKVLVGVDASGLEARCAAHYLYPYDDGALTERVLTGDVHRENAKLLFSKDDITSAERTIAKTSFFAFIYGAQAPKIAKICGISLEAGEKLKKQLDKRFPMISKFRYTVEKKAQKGFLWGLDGRKIFIRTNKWGRPDSPVNYLFQSAGAVLMKKALVLANQQKPDIKFVLNVHDELQFEADSNEAEDLGKYVVNCIKLAGVDFQFLCPLDGEVKIGNNWAETH